MSQTEVIEHNFRTLVRSDSYRPDFDVLLAQSDVIDFLATVPDASVNLVVTSPPYNIGKAYERRVSLESFMAWQASVLAECKRVLAPTGSLCWQVGNYVESGEVFPLDSYFYGVI